MVSNRFLWTIYSASERMGGHSLQLSLASTPLVALKSSSLAMKDTGLTPLNKENSTTITTTRFSSQGGDPREPSTVTKRKTSGSWLISLQKRNTRNSCSILTFALLSRNPKLPDARTGEMNSLPKQHLGRVGAL